MRDSDNFDLLMALSLGILAFFQKAVNMMPFVYPAGEKAKLSEY